MAYRDRSQSIAFVYTHPLKLLKAFNLISQSQTTVATPDFEKPMGVLEAEKKKHEETAAAITRLKTNLTKLEEMQNKLRFMLGELEKVSFAKKKN
jgi:hypothetical protein